MDLLGLQHCSGINCLTGPNGLKRDTRGEFLFSGSRDGTLKRWELGVGVAVCGATFESHVDWVFFHTITVYSNLQLVVLFGGMIWQEHIYYYVTWNVQITEGICYLSNQNC